MSGRCLFPAGNKTIFMPPRDAVPTKRNKQMTSSNLDRVRINLIDANSGKKGFAKLSRNQKEHVIRSVFLRYGREVDEDWRYINSSSKIPFTYRDHEEEAWNGIRFEQSLEKFKRGQEASFSGLQVDQKVRLIENYLRLYYDYTGPNKLIEEIKETPTLRKLKIRLYCAKHGWNEPARAQGFTSKDAKGSCLVYIRGKANALKMDMKRSRKYGIHSIA